MGGLTLCKTDCGWDVMNMQTKLFIYLYGEKFETVLVTKL